MSEEWRPIPGFSRYEISDLGNVRSAVQVRNRPPGTPIAQHITVWGYRTVGLTDDTGDHRPRSVARLVLRTFRGEAPDGCEARHLDGDRLNNALTNLAWGTKAENAADRIAHGRQVRGSAVNTSRLTAEQVREIRRLNAEHGLGDHRLSRRFGVARNAIRMILNGKSWAHLS